MSTALNLSADSPPNVNDVLVHLSLATSVLIDVSVSVLLFSLFVLPLLPHAINDNTNSLKSQILDLTKICKIGLGILGFSTILLVLLLFIK